MRLLIIGTHPCHTTGYSKAMYNMITGILKHSDDINVTVFGIQKYYTVTENTRDFPEDKRLHIYDVLKYDEEDYGYGTKSLQQFLEINRPDIVFIYNDAYVSSQYIKIVNNSSISPKIILYLDQIYKYQLPENVTFINNNIDHLITFSETWKQSALDNYFDEPISVVKHCIDNTQLELSVEEARHNQKLPLDKFIFLNLNRNQTRKRPDLTIQGYVEFLYRHPEITDTLLIMGNTSDNTYNLKDIFENECRMRKMICDFEKIIVNEIRFPDNSIQELYISCDVGINTCDGEGFGLCNYEHAYYGKPQIVSNVGGLRDHFNDTNSIVLEPKLRLYGALEDKIPDMGEIIDPNDLADAMYSYYNDKDLYNKHSQRKPECGWDDECKKLVSIISDVCL
jgi:glycosyltransferase involved in cell wall biosynthesis